MAEALKATTFSSRSNAKRAAEKAIAAGSAPSIDYGIKERASGRFEITWHDRAAEARERLGMPLGVVTEYIDPEFAVRIEAKAVSKRARAEKRAHKAIEAQIKTEARERLGMPPTTEQVSDPFARVEASEAAENPIGYRDRLLAADAERRQTLAEPAEAETAEAEMEAHINDPFPEGTRVRVLVVPGMGSRKKYDMGTVQTRVGANAMQWRVLVDGQTSPAVYDCGQLSLPEAEPVAPAEPDDQPAPARKTRATPERKPRAAPTGDRKPSKSAELDAQAAAGTMPTKPIMTSKANPHYQKRFDQLEKWAMADDWNAIRGYEVKGINSYAKMVAAYRDRLLAAHEAQQ
jgi:hypothetical protein